MRFFLILILAFSFNAFSATYRGTIDTGANSVTTSYEAVTTVSQQTKSVFCQNGTSTNAWFSVSGRESNCSDATNDMYLSAGGSGVLDKFPVGGVLCVKGATSSLSAGLVNCVAWWEESTP